MLVEKLQTVDAFVVFDFEDAPFATGVVRCAPKILVDGATWLARSQTYQLAFFELEGSGASAGINAPNESRSEAIDTFVAEVQPWVASRRFLPTAAKGVTTEQLAPLRSVEPSLSDYWERGVELTAAGIVASLDVALGGLDGCSVAIEGFDAVGVQVASGVAERGGRVVAVGTAAGTAADPTGFAPDVLGDAFQSQQADLVRTLASAVEPPDAVLGATADGLVCGSKAGVVDHGVAAGCSARAVVPSGPIPVTAKGLAVLRRQGVRVLPDFVTTAGPLVGSLAPALGDQAPAPADPGAVIADGLRDVLDDEQGPLLGACKRAESFLRRWRPELPFGRPLA